MKRESFIFKDSQGVEIFVYKWAPEDGTKIKAVVQVAHGMAETAARYERFGEALTKSGYMVYANDHRGHGKTAGSLENVGYIGQDGFDWMVRDMNQLNERIKKDNPDIPVILFGHSMGSLLGQRYISLYGDTIKGAILSGTSGKQGLLTSLATIIARGEVKKIGEKTPSDKMNKLSFGSFNKEFEPVRTQFDWLSRDNDEVDKYINDPYCGGVFTAGFFYEFIKGIKELHRKSNMQRIPKDLPIYIFSGEKDPVGKNCKTVKWLVDKYIGLGIGDVEYKFYPDGRHEMLNEINRDEVTEDVIRWLDKH